MKIDCHAHILPESWPSLREKYGYGGWITLDHHRPGHARMLRDDGTFFRDIEQNCWDPVAIMQDMDAHSVDTMVLCTVPVLFSYWAKPDDALDWSMFLNDHLAEVVRNAPRRFIGLGTLPMQDPQLAIRELERCKRELGMPGVQIGTNIMGRNLDDPTLRPFWQAAEALDMAVFVHPWDMLGADRTAKYFLQWLVGMPAETTLAIASMLFGGVFDAFPGLRVMFAHAGGTFPFTMGRISHGYHARPDLCNINGVSDPVSYAGRFWVDGITHDADALRFLLQVMGPEKIAYGTDYPFPLGDLAHGAFIEQMADLDADLKDRLFARNVLDFLKLDAAAYVSPKPYDRSLDEGFFE
ncbi:MAG: amidohydrolase [Candidatus Kapabacteria bacterium]|nr:amidohydrolase [Candidatus Kapabacteria bacterium]